VIEAWGADPPTTKAVVLRLQKFRQTAKAMPLDTSANGLLTPKASPRKTTATPRSEKKSGVKRAAEDSEPITPRPKRQAAQGIKNYEQLSLSGIESDDGGEEVDGGSEDEYRPEEVDAWGQVVAEEIGCQDGEIKMEEGATAQEMRSDKVKTEDRIDGFSASRFGPVPQLNLNGSSFSI
jgi:hypothetical protein